MTSFRSAFMRIVIAAGMAVAGMAAAESADEAAVRQVILSTWDKPQARVEVGPVVVVGRHAVAGWTQGERGGRALMSRDEAGGWSVAACGGDGLRQSRTLVAAGMPAVEARQLSASLAKAESAVPASRRALFATFGALTRMDAPAHHEAHGSPAAVPHDKARQ